MKTKNRYKIFFLTVFSLIALSSFNESKGEIISGGYEIGDEITTINLMNVDRKMVSLTDYPNAKGFIIIFTCNTCPFSVANEDRIIALDNEFKAKGYPVIAINPNNPSVQPDDTFELMQQKANNRGFTFPYLVDKGQEIFLCLERPKHLIHISFKK